MIVECLWDRAAHPFETSLAETYVDGVTDRHVLLLTDLADPRPAVRRIVAGRRNGETIALFPLLADAVEENVRTVSAALHAQTQGDQRAGLLASLAAGTLAVNGAPLRLEQRLEGDFFRNVYAALRSADFLIFTSHEGRHRWEGLLRRPIARFAVLAPPWKPTALRRSGAGIVVYAPELPRDALRFFDLAFAQRRNPVTYISIEAAGSPAPPGARVAVVAGWHEIGHTVRLHELGFTVVAPRMTGVAEIGSGFAYEPTDVVSLNRAVDRALAGDVSGESPCRTNLQLQFAREAPPHFDGPLVSIVVRTVDRPAMLQRALASIAAQTYANIEVVVVNDGPPLGSLEQPGRGGMPVTVCDAGGRANMVASLNIGVRAARGTYVGYLDDDDRLHPDHVARVVQALETTGYAAAYTNCLGEYEDAGSATTEYAVYTDRDFDRDLFCVHNLFTIHSLVHRRDLFARHGYFDETLGACEDWEMWLRFAQEVDFLHVDRITCEYSHRLDPSAMNLTSGRQHDFARAHAEVYGRLASLTAQRPTIRERQQGLLALVQERAKALDADPSRLRELLFVPPAPAV